MVRKMEKRGGKNGSLEMERDERGNARGKREVGHRSREQEQRAGKGEKGRERGMRGERGIRSQGTRSGVKCQEGI